MHVRVANLQWRGKHSRRMRNPQFYVSGKRPMAWWLLTPNHFLNQLWFIFVQTLWHSPGHNITKCSTNLYWNDTLRNLNFERSLNGGSLLGWIFHSCLHRMLSFYNIRCGQRWPVCRWDNISVPFLGIFASRCSNNCIIINIIDCHVISHISKYCQIFGGFF